ncbi:MAG: helix-turn-helix domain-containing protein [Ruminococcaceae bacterium]|nr:helix-turn-helix domain-containing protein [Oscillospiraceae bacterium]
MTMGQIIKKLRKERDLTQEELAEQLNITAQAVSRWESGTGMPDISQIVPLANAFGVSTDVLFGMQDQDADAEVERFIGEIECKICNRPEDSNRLVYYKECCDDVQKMLEVYPNHYRLLAYSLGNICCLLTEYKYSDEMKDKKEEIQRWESACIRQANVILNHCTDSRYLNSANKWLAVLYRDKDNYVKMLEHAEKITVFDPYEEGGDWQALAYHLLDRKEESRKQSAENIYKALEYLQGQLYNIGCAWEIEGKFEEAYTCHRLYPGFYDLMVGEREDEMPFCLGLHHERCALACMRLNRPDEAMDWLEKLVRHERMIAKNYNVITATKLPYFYGRELHYSKETYPVQERITPILAWKAFDPIRETERFKTILADAEAFERGE